jgi:2-isopropylmalate synthase
MGRSKISVFDTTLRDGEQSPGCSMTPSEKLGLARQLDRLGVDVIEAGFPISSDADFESVKTIAERVRRPVIAALARAVPGDVDRAWKALEFAERPRIHTFLATSDIHLSHKLKISRQQAVDQACGAVSRARSFLRRCRVFT